MKYIAVLLLVLAICMAGGFTGQVCKAVEQPGIYYIDRQGNLEKEYQHISTDCHLYFALAQAVVQQPVSSQLSSAIPVGTRLKGAWLDQGTAYVDYTKELFSYGGGTFREQRLLAQIVYTLTQLPEIQRVQILIEGHKALAPEGMPTDGPLTRDDLPLMLKEGKAWPEER